MKKRLLIVMPIAFVLVVLISILVGCGPKVVDEKTEEQAEEGNIVFTAITTYTIGGTEWGQDPVSRKITEETGVELELEYTTGDFNEKLGALLAAGDYPEIILSVDNYQLADLIDAGALLPFNDYLDNGGGENIKAVFGDKLGAMRHPDDGNYYGFNKEFGKIPETPDCYVQVMYPVLEEFGYPEIKDLYELGDYLEQYIEKYQTYNDLPLIGIMSPAGGDSLRHGINNTALRTAGFQDDGEFYIDPETYEATYGVTHEATKEYLKWVNDMYHRGLFTMDSFNLDHNMVEQEVLKGNVLCITSPVWAVDDTERTIRSVNGTPERTYAKIPIYISEEAKTNSQVTNYDSLGTWKSVITSNCHNPEAAFEFFDTMWSEEMQILANWGIEGQQYTEDENGVRTLTDEAINAYRNDANFRTESGASLYNYWSVGTLVKDSTGQYVNPFLTPETIAESYTDEDREVIAAYDEDAMVWKDLWPEAKLSYWGFAWKLILPRGDGKKAQTKVKEEIAPMYMLKMVQAETDDEFNALWDEFIDKCEKAGIRQREDEVTAAIKQRIADWYE